MLLRNRGPIVVRADTEVGDLLAESVDFLDQPHARAGCWLLSFGQESKRSRPKR